MDYNSELWKFNYSSFFAGTITAHKCYHNKKEFVHNFLISIIRPSKWYPFNFFTKVDHNQLFGFTLKIYNWAFETM